MKKNNRPMIKINRIPTGEKALEELVADVYCWVIENQIYVKSSDDTFENTDNSNYNDNITMTSGGDKDGTAA